MKRFIAVCLSLVLALLPAFGLVSVNASATPYETYKSHPHISLYGDNNIPYDDANALGKYLFITPYLAQNPTGGAVIVFPGGGYSQTSNGKNNEGNQYEASDIGKRCYHALGISVFVVNYRTRATDPTCDYHEILADATRAVKYIRYHAADFGIDPEKIAVMGYSAGGHLATMMCTHWDFKIDDPKYVPDEIDAVSARPDAGVLCYAVCSLDKKITHSGTRTNFTGGNDAYINIYSGEKSVTKDTPPIFLWCNAQDGTVPSECTMRMAAALEKQGIEYEVHIFYMDGDAHGTGLAQGYPTASKWTSMSGQFLKDHAF